MHQWECKVAMPQPNGGAPYPVTMTCSARNYLEARAYFTKFGKLLNDPRIIS